LKIFHVILKEKKMSEQSKRNREEECNSIIKNHMIWSMGAGLIPVPIADIFAVSAIQLDMIRQLAKVYDVDFQQTQGKAYITALTGTGLARLGARAVKFIPGIGSIVGGITMAALSGASSYALGEVFKKHFETGGTFLDFDPQRLKKYYDEKFEKGKEVAEEIRVEKDTIEKVVKVEEPDSVLDQLKELGQLKDQGHVTQEEFEALKKRILGN
jgi:uncharacterized protein (DUF697 family)